MVNGCLVLATQNEILKGLTDAQRQTMSRYCKDSAMTINQEAGFSLAHLASVYTNDHLTTLTHQTSKHKRG